MESESVLLYGPCVRAIFVYCFSDKCMWYSTVFYMVDRKLITLINIVQLILTCLHLKYTIGATLLMGMWM